MAEENGGPHKTLRVLELFSGIGGLHWALKVARVPCKVVAAMEINPTVLETYKFNFGDTNVVRKNLQGITSHEINELKIDAIVMSPPCQPFCRTGNRLDTEDNRTGPLNHLTQILPEINLKYIFVENVQGFEVSSARENLLEALKKLNFQWQEFMLTPKCLGVPNSRLRYYLIGKKKDLPWKFELQQETLLSNIPNWEHPESTPFQELKSEQEDFISFRRKKWKEICDSKVLKKLEASFCVGDIIEWDLSEENLAKLKVPNSVIEKYYQAMDIVTPVSVCTCCFTKGYGHFIKGTGSILNDNLCDGDETKAANVHECTAECIMLKCDNKINLRYFSPKEISRLMCYPEEFKMPENLSLKQKYKSLGNSVNVYVVAILFTLLF
ncbi:tRNA (cytosine(38)-C(5))-methyltransferase [Orchesella cincta]|uniref:tRNA (cytosine(38)-C(5))-methyltransferase n=1 Tax=Orchesella cincta TaxID=48709 RepID=A0A1D2N2J5_ORCCI|nr:tRNA (cytosine(38)-C(5))-methyltransferase [Orchesella cincta]